MRRRTFTSGRFTFTGPFTDEEVAARIAPTWRDHAHLYDRPSVDPRYALCSCGSAVKVYADAEDLKQEGITRALEPDRPYNVRFTEYVVRLPRGTRFTSEDVTAAVGLPRRPDGTVNPGKVGALMHALARRRLIVAVGFENGKRKPSHAAMLTVWVRL